MEDKKKTKTNVVSNIWKNWCSLEATQRTEVAEKLGPLGHILSIAANVHQLATNPEALSGDPQNQNNQNENSSSQSNDDTEEEFIDVEYEEVP
jgi:hypothetical protein